MRDTTSTDRDRALARLRRVTALSLAAAGTLVAAFAGLAARALPGRTAAKAAHTQVRTQGQPATPPPLVSAQSAATPAPPAAPPSQAQSAPVVVSGGS